METHAFGSRLRANAPEGESDSLSVSVSGRLSDSGTRGSCDGAGVVTTMVGTAQALTLPGLSRATDERLTGKADEPRNVRFYRRLRFIRRFEETLLALFDEGLLNGTTHCCIGQEADSVGVVEHLEQGDHIFSNHRCHGHYLARTGDARGLLLEIMGHAEGVCGGIGGSQHICAPGFKSNGIQGGILPTAAGIALAERLRQSDRVSAVFIGDGTLGEAIREAAR